MNYYFAPDQDCLTPLLEVINNSTKSVTVADYSFSAPPVTDALVTKHLSGVPVRVVLDKSQSGGKVEKPEIAKLQNAGVDYVIRESDKHRIMHLKVVVGDDTVGFGSYNFTNAAASENNVLAVTTDPTTAELFTTQIQKIYDQPSNLTLERTVMNYKDVVVRAVKTFCQAVVAFAIAHLADISGAHSVTTSKQLAFAALVAGVSAVWNLVLVPLAKPVTAKLGL